MQAAQISEYGGPDKITINDIAMPEPGDNQVVVKVRTTAINPFDWKLRRGYMKAMIPLDFPVTIGADFSGIVSEVGKNITNYKPGDEVYGSAIILGGGSGAVAEYAAVNETSIGLKPTNVSHQEAASLVLVGVSAIQAIDNHLKLGVNQKILIHGGAGGIGSVAIEYAKHLGAYVAATARSVDSAFVKKVGADEVVDYENETFEDKVSGYDAVFDTVGGETYKRSFKVLNPGGIIVSMVEQPDNELVQKYNVKAEYQASQTDTKTLNFLRKQVEENSIHAHIDKVFDLGQVQEAFRYAEEDHPKGKVVIVIK